MTRRRRRLLAALALCAALATAACQAPAAAKSGARSTPTPTGHVTLRFAAAEPQQYDDDFVRSVERLSGGTVDVQVVPYDLRSMTVDVELAKDVAEGRIDVVDVAARAWSSRRSRPSTRTAPRSSSSNRELLDAASQGPAAADALATLSDIGVTGLAVVPRSVRYLFSTRPIASLADFAGRRVRINANPPAEQTFRAWGATVDETTPSAGPTLDALNSGSLDAVESDIQSATVNGYVDAAPYVLAAPLWAKVTTFAASTARLDSLGPQVGQWVTQAAVDAARSAPGLLDDTGAWADGCGAGLVPVPISAGALDELHAKAHAVYARIGSTQDATKLEDRIGDLAVQHGRADIGPTCGPDQPPSSTPTLDGTSTTTLTSSRWPTPGTAPPAGTTGTSRS